MSALMIPLGNALGAGVLSALLVAAPFGACVWLLRSTGPATRSSFAAGCTSGDAHAGLWRLHRDARVLRTPDRSVLPPGWYPSPYHPGLLQRWDGSGRRPLPQRWLRHEHLFFRAPGRPFL